MFDITTFMIFDCIIKHTEYNRLVRISSIFFIFRHYLCFCSAASIVVCDIGC